MKQLVHYLPWSTVPAVDEQWRRLVAGDMLDSLCQSRLAKVVCAQLRERLKSAHDSFANALRNLEAHHNERLEKTEEQGFRLRKVHAPRLARLALETSSIIDCLLYCKFSRFYFFLITYSTIISFLHKVFQWTITIYADSIKIKNICVNYSTVSIIRC